EGWRWHPSARHHCYSAPGLICFSRSHPRDAVLRDALGLFGRRSRLYSAKWSSQHVSAQLNVLKLTEPVSSLRYSSTTRPPERGHEAGAAMQAANPYALRVFVNPKAWAIRTRKAEINDNRVRWYGQHQYSPTKLQRRFART